MANVVRYRCLKSNQKVADDAQAPPDEVLDVRAETPEPPSQLLGSIQLLIQITGLALFSNMPLVHALPSSVLLKGRPIGLL